MPAPGALTRRWWRRGVAPPLNVELWRMAAAHGAAAAHGVAAARGAMAVRGVAAAHGASGRSL